MSPSFTFGSGNVSSVTGTGTVSQTGMHFEKTTNTNTINVQALTIEARIQSHDRGNKWYRPATSGQNPDSSMPMSGLYWSGALSN
jgi:hypothetical protein